ncbi:MAG: tetratricopeptide repeat protein [Verrucomicrobiales bacterium]|nr:tetratricopeptide repeat protein [Verrucomicrobiales bacterium]
MRAKLTGISGTFLLIVAAIATSPGRDDSPLKRAESLFSANKFAEARPEFEAALPGLAPQDRALPMIRIGYCFERENRFPEAIATYREILKLDPISPADAATARLRMGYAMRRDGDDRKAIPILLEAAAEIEASPNTRAEALLYAAWAHGVLEETDQALELFRQVETIPDVPGNLSATANLNIGRIFQKRGQLKEAIASYRKLEDFHPVAMGNQARARIHILECEALLEGDTPFHIRPWVSQVRDGKANVFWVSQGAIEKGEVLVSAEGYSAQVQPETSSVRDTICHLHTAKLTGLPPGSEIGYEVRCAEKSAAGTFKTPPPAGNAIRFCVIGDTQSYHPGLQQLLDRMGEEDADFVIHVGDLVDRGDVWGEWKAGFFDPGYPYLKNAAFWPVYGNHDGGPYFPTFFKETPQGYYYSYDWGDAHFVVLDSYGPGSGRSGREKQLAWLQADLEANQKKWTIVSLHVPMIATRAGIPKFGQEDFLPLLEQHGVDLVFTGHHPQYRRYLPIGPPGKKPVIHITTGGGGGPVGGSLPSPLLAKSYDRNHYTLVSIEGNRLEVRAKAIDGEILDEFEIRKEGDRFDETWMEQAVDTSLHGKIISLYHELLGKDSRTLELSTEPNSTDGDELKLKLNFDRLSRGPLDRTSIPPEARLAIESIDEDSPWIIPPQSISFSEPVAIIRGTFRPVQDGKTKSNVRLQLQLGERKLTPVEARLLVKDESNQ